MERQCVLSLTRALNNNATTTTSLCVYLITTELDAVCQCRYCLLIKVGALNLTSK